MAINRNKTIRVPVHLPKEMTKEIDAYVSLNDKLTSRSKGIKYLIQKGLASEYRKSKQLRLDVKQIMNEDSTKESTNTNSLTK